MKKINNVKRIYRAYITYVDNNMAYDTERFYIANYEDKLQKVIEDIFWELKNDFEKYNDVEIEVEKMIGKSCLNYASDLILGKGVFIYSLIKYISKNKNQKLRHLREF